MKRPKPTYAELIEARKRLDAEIEAAKKSAFDELVRSIRVQIAASGFTLKDVAVAMVRDRSLRAQVARLGTKPPADSKTYRNPETGETWKRVKGHRPKWLLAKIAEGAKMEDFEI